MKSLVILKEDPGILKRGGETKYWETKKDAERVVYMAMGQKAREHGEDDLCQTKSWGEERMLWGDESEAVKVTVDD